MSIDLEPTMQFWPRSVHEYPALQGALVNVLTKEPRGAMISTYGGEPFFAYEDELLPVYGGNHE